MNKILLKPLRGTERGGVCVCVCVGGGGGGRGRGERDPMTCRRESSECI